ncbi:MAG: Asp-tRNA(Asn)/Glu-tRNA(Gln) amidotransferase subunit GatC [Candidatus Woesearchaeota archaeon]
MANKQPNHKKTNKTSNLITKEYLLEIAKNSRLNLSEQELNELMPQLSEILTYFSEIQKIETENTKPSFQPIELKNNFREDIVKKSTDNETALKNTMHKKDGYFKGPRIL